MSAPLASISNRLTSAQAQLLERSRVISLGLVPSPSASTSLVRTLTAVRNDLAKAGDEMALERTGLTVGGASTGKGRASSDATALDELEERYDRLVEMLQGDEDGRNRAKALVREKRVPSPAPQSDDEDDEDVAILEMNVNPPSPSREPIRPFKDYDDDEEDSGQSHNEIIDQQQLMMNDQDERLTLLSHSINRQSHLSVQIGDELDIHHELLEDTDAAMDRTAARLNSARRRLDHVADNAKQYGSTITIIVLIVILLLLIIVFKT